MENGEERRMQISEIWRFPVKSMGGEMLQSCSVVSGGLVGDRAYALRDVETGKVASAKTVRKFGKLMQCTARFTSEPESGVKMPPVEITLPDGRILNTSDPSTEIALSEFLGRQVVLIAAAPEVFMIDQYHPDIEAVDPGGNRDTTVEQPLGGSLFAAIDAQSPLPKGSLQDVFPLSIITTSTLAEISKQNAEADADVKRFRMNLVVKGADEGFAENDWVGKTLKSSDGNLITVAMPDPRCVMVTLPTAGLPQNIHTLRTIVSVNRVDISGLGSFPCAGVYGMVTEGRQLVLGDQLTVS